MIKTRTYLGPCVALALAATACGDDSADGIQPLTDASASGGGSDDATEDDETDNESDDGADDATEDEGPDAGGDDGSSDDDGADESSEDPSDGGADPDDTGDDPAVDGGMDAGAGPTITLANPIHVVPGAAAEGADGSEEKPFASVYDAAEAILAAGDWDGKLVMHEGEHELPETVTLPRTADLEFLPGATMLLGYQANFNAQRDVKSLGEEMNPVTFSWLREGQHWGTFNLFEETSQENVFQYTVFAHGGEGQFQGIGVRGALSLESASALITDCTFMENEGDDALSVGKSNSVIQNNLFIDNFLDAIDIDGAGETQVVDNVFTGNGNDAVDCGEGATFLVQFNLMEANGDKGVSIGETSTPVIMNNLIIGNFIGIGVKDGSDPDISNNTLYKNQYGLASYEAIAGLGTGKGRFSNGIIWASEIADVALVEGGAEFAYSCVQSGGYVSSVVLEGEEGVAAAVSDGGVADGGASGGGSGLMPFDGPGMMGVGTGCDDPLFADPDNGDFHLKSVGGRYEPSSDSWVIDEVTSPAVDKGDPELGVAEETEPNGGVLNMGRYGGTAEASRSPSE